MRKALAAIALAFVGVSGARAIEIFNIIAPTNIPTNGTSYVLGFSFGVSSPIRVTGLSIYDASTTGGLGLQSPEPVGLWAVSGAPFRVTTVVSPTDPLDGFFRVHSIAPFILEPGGYEVVAVTGPDYDFAFTMDPANISQIPEVWFGVPYYEVSDTLRTPHFTNGGYGYLGGNVQVAIPDTSSTLMLLAMSLAGLAALASAMQERGINQVQLSDRAGLAVSRVIN